MEQSKHIIKWRGREIEVRFDPDYSEGYEDAYGYKLCHLEIKAVDGRPLPISETGYRSRFDRTDKVEAAGGPAAFAQEWLELVAIQSAKPQKTDPRQISLL
jgi:hypothetical protein